MILQEETKLYGIIAAKTGIPADVLRGNTLISNVSTAIKMSWASKRITTRIEDEAYCLLGIFDVNMPMIYGEGRRAFTRLQEEILRRSHDQTIFAWSRRGATQLLATSAADFESASSLLPSSGVYTSSRFELSSRGLQISLTLVRKANPDPRTVSDSCYILLDCYREEDPGALVALEVTRSAQSESELVFVDHHIQYLNPGDDLSCETSLNVLFDVSRSSYLRYPASNQVHDITILRDAPTKPADMKLPIRIAFKESSPTWKLKESYPEGTWKLEALFTEVDLPGRDAEHRSVLRLCGPGDAAVLLFLNVGEKCPVEYNVFSNRFVNEVRHLLVKTAKTWSYLKKLFPFLGRHMEWFFRYWTDPGLANWRVSLHLAAQDASLTNPTLKIDQFLAEPQRPQLPWRLENHRLQDHIRVRSSLFIRFMHYIKLHYYYRMDVRVEETSIAYARHALQIVFDVRSSNWFLDGVEDWGVPIFLLPFSFIVGLVVMPVYVLILLGIPVAMFLKWTLERFLDSRERRRYR